MSTKRILAVALLLTSATLVWANPPAPIVDSIESEVTYEVFRNELDAAVTARQTSAGPAFAELTGNYLLFGLTNLDQVNATGNVGMPWIGYYNAGDMPWSYVTRFDGNQSAADRAEVAENYNTKNITEGTTTETIEWLQNRETFDYAPRVFDDFDADQQFLVSLGGMTTGLRLDVSRDYNGIPVSDVGTETEERFQDAEAADATADPESELVWTREREFSDFSTGTDPRTTNVTATVPIALSGNGIRHFAQVQLGIQTNDESSSETQEYSFENTAENIAGLEEFENETTNYRRTISATLWYEAGLGAIFDGHDDNELLAGGSFNIDSTGVTYTLSEDTQNFEIDGNGDRNNTGRTVSEDNFDVSRANPFMLSAWAEHAFYGDLGEQTRVGVRPRGVLEVEFGGNGPAFTRLEQEETNFDGNGDQTDRTVEVEEGGENVVWEFGTGPVARESEVTYTGTLSLPMGLEFHPSDLPFAFLAGSTPSATFERTTTRSDGGTYTETVSDFDANDDLTNRTIREYNAGNEFVNVENDLTAEADHSLGLRFIPTENLTVDMSLNGSNFWQFENLSFQAIFQF